MALSNNTFTINSTASIVGSIVLLPVILLNLLLLNILLGKKQAQFT